MKRALGWFWILAAGGWIVFHILAAIGSIRDLYATAGSDPLGERALSTAPGATADPESQIAARIGRSALIGAAGLPFFLIGRYLVRSSRRTLRR